MIPPIVIDNIKAIAVVAAAFMTIGGALAYFDDYLPAHRGYVLAQANTVRSIVVDIQLDQATARRDSLRREKFDREQELKKNPSAWEVRERLTRVEDQLDQVERKIKQLSGDKD